VGPHDKASAAVEFVIQKLERIGTVIVYRPMVEAGRGAEELGR